MICGVVDPSKLSHVIRSNSCDMCRVVLMFSPVRTQPVWDSSICRSANVDVFVFARPSTTVTPVLRTPYLEASAHMSTLLLCVLFVGEKIFGGQFLHTLGQDHVCTHTSTDQRRQRYMSQYPCLASCSWLSYKLQPHCGCHSEDRFAPFLISSPSHWYLASKCLFLLPFRSSAASWRKSLRRQAPQSFSWWFVSFCHS